MGHGHGQGQRVRGMVPVCSTIHSDCLRFLATATIHSTVFAHGHTASLQMVRVTGCCASRGVRDEKCHEIGKCVGLQSCAFHWRGVAC